MRPIICISAALALLTACRPSLQEGVAVFEDFTYEGKDSFYESNPLPGEDYVYNPILPGWYSDPSICTNGEGDYFLVTSSFSYFPGVPIFHSRDLVNWKQIGHVLNRPSQLVNLDRQGISGGIFAPDIKYNPANRTYYMITTNVGAGNFVVKTEDPFGEWSDPIMLPQVQGIDPSLFFDDDGKAYIVNNDDAPDGKPEYDGHRTIRIVEYDTKNDCTVGERKIIINKGVDPSKKPIWIEGPHLYKINGKYYLMAAEGGTSDMHSEVIFRSDSPMEGYKPWNRNPILTQRHLYPGRDNPVTCAGHADLVRTESGDWWAVFLGCRPNIKGYENLGRETFMVPVRWSDDGFPILTEGLETVPLVVRHPGTTVGENPTFGNFTVKDDFDGESFSPEWMTLRAPADERITVKDGVLTLVCDDTKSTEFASPSLILRRLQHHAFTASTSMRFIPSGSSSAGMLLFKDEQHQYYLKVYSGQNGPMIAVEKVGNENVALGTLPLPGKYGYLELSVSSPDGRTFSFSCGVDGAEKEVVAENVDASYLSTAVAGGFTGTTVGLYATK